MSQKKASYVGHAHNYHIYAGDASSAIEFWSCPGLFVLDRGMNSSFRHEGGGSTCAVEKIHKPTAPVLVLAILATAAVSGNQCCHCDEKL